MSRTEGYIIYQASRPSDYTYGLNRMPSVDPHFDWTADFREYMQGFKEGVQNDFGIKIEEEEIPGNDEQYEVFLSGMAFAEPPNMSGKIKYVINRLERVYKLGLKLGLLHLGYPIGAIDGMTNRAIESSDILEECRNQVQEIRSRLPQIQSEAPVFVNAL